MPADASLRSLLPSLLRRYWPGGFANQASRDWTAGFPPSGYGLAWRHATWRYGEVQTGRHGSGGDKGRVLPKDAFDAKLDGRANRVVR
jgi:hypothetical protein